MWRRRLQSRELCLFAPAFAASLAVSTSLFADTVTGTRSAELKERAHDITLTVEPGHAELVVRRTVYNGGPRHDQSLFWIDVPYEAVAVGLRTLGSLAGRPHWFEGELFEAEAAAARYRELTGFGVHFPKDPALLSWRSQHQLTLQVFPCFPARNKSVEYTLVVPTHYRDGAHHLELGALGTDELTAAIVVRPKRGQELTVGGAPPPAVIRPEHDAPLDFALSAAGAPKLGGELVTSEFGPGRVLVRYAAYAGPRLSEVPKSAHIVVAIDASLSTDSTFVDRARVALDAYLSHFEEARVEVLTFHRRVERVFGAFRPLPKAREALSSLAVQRKNGSEVDRALFEADRLLASAPAGSARRIVLVTDGLARQGLTGERLRAATSRSGAVTHVGLLESGGPALERDDGHPWASGLAANHGLMWRAYATDADASELRRVYEEWARPVRFHNFHAYSAEPDFVETLEGVPSEVDEGQGVEALLISTEGIPWLGFEGELWTEHVAARFEPDRRREKLWSALVFGSPLLGELSQPEMMTLATRGGAVSPVTSYLAIEPGVRPSTEGLDRETGQGFGAGSARLGGIHRTTGRAQPIDRDAFLKRSLADDWRRCGGRPGTASVSFETTGAEIAYLSNISIGEPDALLEACLSESVWSLILPAAFYEPWNVWSVYL